MNYKIYKNFSGGVTITEYVYNPIQGHSYEWNSYHIETIGL